MDIDNVRSTLPRSRRTLDSAPRSMAHLADPSAFLELLLQATQDGIVDWDLASNIESYNPRWMYLFGFDDESRARPREWRALVHPEEVEHVTELIQDHLREGWPLVATLRMRHSSGGYRTILLRGVAQRDAELRPVRMVLIFSDISESKALEARHVALAAALPDTVFRANHAGMILEVKPGADHEHSPFRLLAEGVELARCLPAAMALRLLEALNARTSDASEWRSLEFVTAHGPASALHHEVRVVPSGADECVCIVRDVSERHVLADRLLQAEKLGAIGQLAAGVAHEINTPMQYIGDNLHFAKTAIADVLSHVERVKELVLSAPSGDVKPEDLEVCEEAADLAYVRAELPLAIERSLEGIERMTAIVRGLKAFAHPSGRELSDVDIAGLIESTVAVATNEWKYVAQVDVSIDPTLPQVRCSGGEIGQVLLNLVVNAAHAISARVGDSGDKGRISIAASRDGERCELRVKDTGTGIPEHARARVFEPFFTTKEVGKGTGQGLSIAHSFVVGHHQGSIRFETALGVGTTFIVSLPIAGPDVAVAASLPPPDGAT